MARIVRLEPSMGRYISCEQADEIEAKNDQFADCGSVWTRSVRQPQRLKMQLQRPQIELGGDSAFGEGHLNSGAIFGWKGGDREPSAKKPEGA